eukprot:scaffold682154_cov99-Prasinocladus_malaysianus.AAC.2
MMKSSTSVGMGVVSTHSAPTLEELLRQAESTPTALDMKQAESMWEKGEGPPHTDCKLRLFGRSEDEVGHVQSRTSA